MPLAEIEPKLDDRTFEDLYRDLRLRIPIYTKEWTNFNESDPGITLLQLFAWLSEMMLAQMNKIPRKNYIKFLRLLGQELRPAKPATAHLTFLTKANEKAQPVPARAQVSAQLTDGGQPVIFETEQSLDLIQAPLAVVGVSDGGVLVNVTSANEKPGTRFRPFGWFASPGSALYLGFQQLDPTLELDPFPDEIVFRVFLPPDTTAGEPQRVDDIPLTASVGLIWEYRERDGADWERLNVFKDETAAFTRDGYIRLEGPREIEPSSEARLGAEPRYWIRARIESGSYPEGQSPEIDIIRPNTVPAESLTTVQAQVLGQSQGQPDEIYALPFRPVQPTPLRIVTEQNNQTEEWQRVDDFLSAKPESRYFVLNATAGTIKFGDGDRGRIPTAGALIIADEFRYGGGSRGNQAGIGAIKNPQSVLTGVDKVKNERAAVGGADEQTIQEMLRDAPSLVKRRERAVTAEDFKSYAMEAGGVKNALAIANAHPDFPGVEVPGAVTVVIVPDSGDTPPKPSNELIASVCSRLEPKRLITTEIYVRGPEFREVRVEAFVQAKPNASFDTVSRNVSKALDKFLDPKNWIFGDDLHPTKIFRAVLDADTNVVAVKNLNIYVDGRPHLGLEQIRLSKGELVYGRGHLIVVSPAQDF
ncbi:MAG: putative baseplate assembly protein [Acidobacteriota bacterium]